MYMSDFERLKFIVEELNLLLTNSKLTPKTPVKKLKNDIINYLINIDPHLQGLERSQTSNTEFETKNWLCSFPYNCIECDKEIYRKEVNLKDVVCNDCNEKNHNIKRIELFY